MEYKRWLDGWPSLSRHIDNAHRHCEPAAGGRGNPKNSQAPTIMHEWRYLDKELRMLLDRHGRPPSADNLAMTQIMSGFSSRPLSAAGIPNPTYFC
jgi:hypothetical protein